jgi:two-component system chemotaxis sensor kinase CheA
MDQVFTWSGKDVADAEPAAVLVLHAGSRAIAAGVSSLLGTQDLVVKSLDENFQRIRGLGGASILGDGEVCLMLDVSAVIDMTMRARSAVEIRE